MPAERIVQLPSAENFWSVGGPRPLRPRLRDQLGLGRGARLRRAGLRARLRPLRPLSRVLEPRLHGVRAASRRDADPAARAEHRHRDGPRAARGDRPGRAEPLDLRDGRLPGDHGVDRRRERRRLRRVARGRDEGAPRPRRPRPGDDVPRRRRGHPVERGSRLRPPPDRPARDQQARTDRAGGRVADLGRSSSSRWRRGFPSSSSTASGSATCCAPRRSGSRRPWRAA